MQVLSKGEILCILDHCTQMPKGYLLHSHVRAVCETALHYMREYKQLQDAQETREAQEPHRTPIMNIPHVIPARR